MNHIVKAANGETFRTYCGKAGQVESTRLKLVEYPKGHTCPQCNASFLRAEKAFLDYVKKGDAISVALFH